MTSPETFENWPLLENLFQSARRLPIDERRVFLERHAPAGHAMRRELDALLNEHDRQELALDRPALGTSFHVAHPDVLAAELDLLPADRRVGRYQITQVVASGGMGIVCEATQDDLHRKVALKLMRLDLKLPSARRRFQFEAEILARLEHPAIAQIFEAGIHDFRGGVPYFAMEYIAEARPITSYVRDHALPVGDRLELFAKVCDAVHHGHQRGVIHRDLKPANIVVSAQGAPKVIDFGIARVTNCDLAITTLQTDLGQLLGTMQYMSPEQCDADSQHLDTRTDVYSLGIVLYELVCGRLPYSVSESSIYQATRIIKEAAPERPTRVDPRLSHDLEIILLKAVEKDREHRYQSANDLAQDIRRWLSHAPIMARRPSAAYHLRKFSQRHMGLSIALALFLAALVVGTAVSLTLYYRANREVEIAQQMLRFLRGVLAAPAPSFGGYQMRFLDVIDGHAGNIASVFAGQPLSEASIRATFGEVYHMVGEYAKAEQHLEQALEIRRRELGDHDAQTLNSKYQLALLRSAQKKQHEAITMLHEVIALQTQLVAEDDDLLCMAKVSLADTLTQVGRFDEAEDLLREVIAIQRRPETREQLAATLDELGKMLIVARRFDEAEAPIVEALAIREASFGRDSYIATSSRRLYGMWLFHQTRFGEAEPVLREVIELLRRYHSPEHAELLGIRSYLGKVLLSQRKFDEAEPQLRELLNDKRRLFGDDDLLTYATMNDLGLMLCLKGEYLEAEALLKATYDGNRRLLPEQDPELLSSMLNYAQLLMLEDRFHEAEPLCRDAADGCFVNFGDDDVRTLFSRTMLGECLLDRDQYADAEELLHASYLGLRDVRGDRHVDTHRALEALILLYQRTGNAEQLRKHMSLKLAAPRAVQGAR